MGTFRDDDGQKYLMLTNLWHDQDMPSAQRQLSVTLSLGEGIDFVGRLSRETGRSEKLAVTDGRLQLTLPGGTGELLRLGSSQFPGR